MALTCDPLEYRGFDYHFGVGFSIFAQGLRHELGRGGHYKTERENATGFTLYVTHLLELLEAGPEKKRVLVPHDLNPDAARKLRAEGWATIMAGMGDLRTEAARLGIKTVWTNGKIVEI
jgi:ATP phosphoribosyltransferase regulatory subunit